MIEATVGVDIGYGSELGLALHGTPAKYSGHAYGNEEPSRIPAAAPVAVLADMAERTSKGVRSAAKAVHHVNLEVDAAKDPDVEKTPVNEIVVVGNFVLAYETDVDAFGWMVFDQGVSRYSPLCILRRPGHQQVPLVQTALRHQKVKSNPVGLH